MCQGLLTPFPNECLVSIITLVYITRVCVFYKGSLYFFFYTNLTMTVLWLSSASNSADHIKLLDLLFYV